MNSDALASTYYVNNRENHHRGDLSTNSTQISNVLNDLKTVAIAKWMAEIFIPGVRQSGVSGGWVHFGNYVLATERIFQKKSSSGDVFNNTAHAPMLQEALRWEAGATA